MANQVSDKDGYRYNYSQSNQQGTACETESIHSSWFTTGGAKQTPYGAPVVPVGLDGECNTVVDSSTVTVWLYTSDCELMFCFVFQEWVNSSLSLPVWVQMGNQATCMVVCIKIKSGYSSCLSAIFCIIITKISVPLSQEWVVCLVVRVQGNLMLNMVSSFNEITLF